MLAIIFIMIFSGLKVNEITLFNFNEENENNWRIINDGVMGGLSRSNLLIKDGKAIFSGTISPENNGGFASIRAELKKISFDNFDGAAIRVKGDGKIYNLRFRRDENFDGISYQAKFNTQKEQWTIVQIPFNDFSPTFRGRNIKGQPGLISEDLEQIGILIADKQFGEFRIELDWIKLYRNDKNEE